MLDDIWLTVTQQTFDHLFLRTELLRLDACSALISVPDRSMLEWLDQRFRPALTRSLESVTGYAGVQVQFVVGD